MWRMSRFGMLALLWTAAQVAGQGLAQDQGQDDLDRATETKLTATTLSDLGEVIRLCQSALEKGLDEEGRRFAEQLLTSTRIQRGTMVAETIFQDFKNGSPHRMWPQFRRIALEDLEKGLQSDPKRPHVLYRIAQLNLLPGGDAHRAAEAIDQAIRLSKEEPRLRAKALVLRAGLREDPQKRLADLDEAVRTNPRDADVLRARAAHYVDQEEYQLALADLDTALQLEPDDAPTHEERGRVLIDLGRYEEALKSLNEAQRLAPKSVRALFEKARLYAVQSKFETALEVLQQAYLLQPGNPGVLLLRASVYQSLGKEKEALDDVDQVLKLRPGHPLAMRFRARLLARSGKLDLAAAELEKLLETEPDDLDAEFDLALFYSAEGEPQKAIEKLSAVLDKKPDYVPALRVRADTLLGIGKQAEAIADYEKALKLQPDDTGVLNNLAWVLATSPDESLRDGKRSIQLATQACKLTEYKQAHILSTLAAGYAETGDFQTAIKWSQQAVELGPEDQREQLAKELESYRAKKPFRELLTGAEFEGPKSPEPEQSKEPAAKAKEKSEKAEPKAAEKPAPKAKERSEKAAEKPAGPK
jgi:tetratricopeptide (TPR) repeat protein